jgi:hypothetical protein
MTNKRFVECFGANRGFAMDDQDTLDDSTDQIQLIAVGTATLRQAEEMIAGCEWCHPNDAEIPFDNILDRVTGSQPSVTDYILEAPAKCPHCGREILEKTLIEPNSE